MKRIVDHKELRVYWQLNHWYEKAIYVFGVIYTAIIVFSFFIGFIAGLVR